MAIQFKANAAQAAEDQKNAFNIAPKGTYFLTVVDAEEKVSKESKRDMIELEMVIAVGPYAEKTRVWHYLVFIEEGAKGHGMTLHALNCFGFPSDGQVQVSADDFKGKTVKADLDVEVYNGNQKNTVKKFYALTDDELAAEAFSGDVAAQAPKAAPQAQAQANPPVAARPPVAAGGKLPWRR